MKRLSYCFVVVFTLLLSPSCKDFVEIPIPNDVVISSQVFSTDAKATSVITGIYGDMINGSPSFTNFMATIYPGFSVGELDEYNPSFSDQEFITNTLTPENGFIKNFWQTAYKYIYYANVAIAGIQKSKKLSPSVHSQLLGEAKFIRAFCYFYLTNLFGDVPLIINTKYKDNSLEPRSPKAKIFLQITEDLNDAIRLLADEYPTGEPIRPNKYVAEFLLARVCLYQKNWERADSLCTDIINSKKYTILDSLKNVFLADSKEALWQLVPVDGYIPELGLHIYPFSSPRIILTDDLVNAFENGDKRKRVWVDSMTYLGEKYYYPWKYKSLTSTNEEYYMVFRYAEVFFIRAEAGVHENKIQRALDDLNKIRNRAGLHDISKNNPGKLLDSVFHERRIELFAEWGHRWFDLKRSGRIDSVLSVSKSNWEPFKKVYPIPTEQLKLNFNLKQNEGY